MYSENYFAFFAILLAKFVQCCTYSFIMDNGKQKKKDKNSKKAATSSASARQTPSSVVQEVPAENPTSNAPSVAQPPPRSPAKKRPDSLIAYVHQLSPTKRNKKNTLDYWTLSLQTSENTKEALLYSKNKRPLLSENQTRRTPIKIQKFTYTEDNKIVINDMTSISKPLPTEYAFQFDSNALGHHYPKRTVQEIANTNDWELISFSGKVLKKNQPTTVGELRVADTTVADSTGTLTVSLWERAIEMVETSKVYNFGPIQVRSWNGIKKLSGTPNTVIVENHEVDMEIPNSDSLVHLVDDDNIEKQLNAPAILSIDSVETLVYCVNCDRRLTQATADKFIQCARCSSYMRTASCSKKVCARFAVKHEGHIVHLTAFQEALQNVCKEVSTMSEGSIAEFLLELENITITYNSSTSIIKDIRK